MKKLTSTLIFLFFILAATQVSFAQESNPEQIKDKAEAVRLHQNFKSHYSSAQFAETGGTISLATIQELYNQMVNTGTTEIVYKFGRTAADGSGKNMIMFFNDVDASRLDQLKKFKVTNVCPPDCNPGVDNYLK